MNQVKIEGPSETVRGLRDIPDLILISAHTDLLGDDRIRTAAYATDRALVEIEARGATFTITMDSEELEAHLDELFELIDDDEPPVG
jgi:hypothetical protein